MYLLTIAKLMTTVALIGLVNTFPASQAEGRSLHRSYQPVRDGYFRSPGQHPVELHEFHRLCGEATIYTRDTTGFQPRDWIQSADCKRMIVDLLDDEYAPARWFVVHGAKLRLLRYMTCEFAVAAGRDQRGFFIGNQDIVGIIQNATALFPAAQIPGLYGNLDSCQSLYDGTKNLRDMGGSISGILWTFRPSDGNFVSPLVGWDGNGSLPLIPPQRLRLPNDPRYEDDQYSRRTEYCADGDEEFCEAI